MFADASGISFCCFITHASVRFAFLDVTAVLTVQALQQRLRKQSHSHGDSRTIDYIRFECIINPVNEIRTELKVFCKQLKPRIGDKVTYRSFTFKETLAILLAMYMRFYVTLTILYNYSRCKRRDTSSALFLRITLQIACTYADSLLVACLSRSATEKIKTTISNSQRLINVRLSTSKDGALRLRNENKLVLLMNNRLL